MERKFAVILFAFWAYFVLFSFNSNFVTSRVAEKTKKHEIEYSSVSGLLLTIGGAVDALIREGKIDELIAKYDVPYFTAIPKANSSFVDIPLKIADLPVFDTLKNILKLKKVYLLTNNVAWSSTGFFMEMDKLIWNKIAEFYLKDEKIQIVYVVDDGSKLKNPHHATSSYYLLGRDSFEWIDNYLYAYNSFPLLLTKNIILTKKENNITTYSKFSKIKSVETEGKEVMFLSVSNKETFAPFLPNGLKPIVKNESQSIEDAVSMLKEGKLFAIISTSNVVDASGKADFNEVHTPFLFSHGIRIPIPYKGIDAEFAPWERLKANARLVFYQFTPAKKDGWKVFVWTFSSMAIIFSFGGLCFFLCNLRRKKNEVAMI